MASRTRLGRTAMLRVITKMLGESSPPPQSASRNERKWHRSFQRAESTLSRTISGGSSCVSARSARYS